MNATHPTSVSDIQAIIKDAKQVQIIGNGSKTGLSAPKPNTMQISLKGLTGITEYQPDEYTITAYTGTPIHEIQAELKKHGQYLPFDPMLANSATIGGTVASNLSGSRRWRYGGIRDFILGIRVIDGLAREFRVGSKVVKNSAGFDLAKFFVGSMGKYAVLTELTFKIFPEPPDFTTLQVDYATVDDLLAAVYFINQSVFELDALDIQPQGDGWTLWIRLAGQQDTLPQRIDRLLSTLRNKSNVSDATHSDDPTRWDAMNNLSWASNAKHVVKVVLSPRQIAKLDDAIQPIAPHRYYSVGGNVAWVATDDLNALGKSLSEQELTGLVVLGETHTPILGKPIDNVLSGRVKHILDPENKFV